MILYQHWHRHCCHHRLLALPSPSASASPSQSPPGLAIAIDIAIAARLAFAIDSTFAIDGAFTIDSAIASCPRHRLMSSPSPPVLTITSAIGIAIAIVSEA
jgi:hypothetical protein